MARKTKIERGILYKSDYDKLKKNGYIDKINKSVKASITYKLGINDLHTIKEIYTKYEPKAVIDMNCNKCIMKMLSKMKNYISRYEND